MSTSKTLSWRCIMPNPYFQVARTYLRRPFSSLKRSIIIWGILFFFALIYFISVFSEKHEFLLIHLFLFIILFAYWAIHVKMQFADTRASLTPYFRKIHGVVAAMAGIVLSILLPGGIALLIGWQPLGLVSITTFLFGIILWAILRQGFTFFLLIVAVWISTVSKQMQNGIEQIVWGNEPIQVFIIISIGVILSITGIIRLFLLNEEKPEYHLNLKFPIDGRVKLSDLQWRKLEKSYPQRWRRWFANRTVVRLIYHAGHAMDSYWSRIHRWNYSGLSVWFAIYLSIFLNLLLTLIGFFTGTNLPPATRIFVATLIPVILICKTAIVKNSFLSRDLMMPVRRDAYLKQVGMLVAYSQLTMWGVIIAISIVWIFTKTAKPSPEFLIYSISYSVMMQIWLFGLAVWILSFRSFIMTFLIMNIAVVFSAMPIMAFEAQMMNPWRPLILLLGGLLTVIGLLLTWWGYRRWIVADLKEV